MKRMVVRAVAVAVFCAAMIAVANQISFAGIEGKEAKTLAALDDEWSKASVSGDVDRVVSFYAPDAVVYPPDAPVAADPATIRSTWAEQLADKSYKTSWKTTHAGVDHNTGFTSGTYEVTGPDSKVVERGKYLCVWRKGADGKWKSIHDMWNKDSK